MNFIKFLKENMSYLPSAITNGYIYFRKSTRALFIDDNNERIRINPPSDWNETNIDSPAYINNKPNLGSVSSHDIATEIDLSNKIPTSKMVYDVVRNISADVENIKFAVGHPFKAEAIAKMTDSSKVYIYVGTESGMKNGHWYYFNGTSWVDGGAYNGVVVNTDKTLLVDDMAADSSTVGNRIRDLKQETTDIYRKIQINTSNIESLQNSNDNNVSSISIINNNMTEIQEKINNVENDIDDIVSSQIQNINGRIDSIEENINNTIDYSIQNINDRIDTVNDTINDTINVTIQNIDENLYNIECDIDNISNRINEVEENIYQNIESNTNEIMEEVNRNKMNINMTRNETNALRDDTIDLYDKVNQLTDNLTELSARSDSFFNELEVTEDGLVYGSQDGIRINGPYGPFAGNGSGGGSGGSDIIDAIFSATNTTDWTTKTISLGAPVTFNFSWSSIENNQSSSKGTVSITVNNITKATIPVDQGDVSIQIGKYLVSGTNAIRVRISDQYNQGKTWIVNVVAVSLSIESYFSTSFPFDGDITFNYIPYGAVNKMVYFIVDSKTVGATSTQISGKQLSYIIPAQSHGSHTLDVYFESDINGETVRSNTLHYEFISISGSDNDTIISIPFTDFSQQQYSSIVIPFIVYNPTSQLSELKIYINNELVSTQNVDRSEHTYTYKADDYGNLEIKFVSGYTEKSIVINVEKLNIDVNAETESLSLHLFANGRSNDEDAPDRWEYQDIHTEFTGFNWNINGWKKDNDGIDVLRLNGDARIRIPYKLFGSDFKNTGKTIEFEFATRDVVDYSATIVSCMYDNIGLQITPQSAIFKGAQTELNTLYKDNEHVRLSITVEKQNEFRLILFYINGIMSRAIQYASGERFSQLNPADILIGSNDCGIDIYRIRVYDNNLTRSQIVNNWIADTQIGSLMVERYNHNNVYDEYGEITTETLPNDLPYFIIMCPELPQFKGDKKIVNGIYYDPVNSSKSFEFEGCQINVQGTSSAPYYRKNYDMQFKKGFKLQSGEIVSSYGLKDTSIPFNRFVLKADVASSESTNNTGLTSFYNDTCPYKTPEMKADSRVRWGIEGVPAVLFWYNTETQSMEFLGKVNFNLPKRSPGPYGYPESEEATMESWEWQRNNSSNVKFQDDDFVTMSYDAATQESYPEWYDDFEARFPSDAWRDYTKLKELLSWVKSTWRDQATYELLPSPVVYKLSNSATISNYQDDNSYTVVDEQKNGVSTGNKIITFTKDTPAYRLSKFKAELANYVETESAYYYYLFTEMFLMIDSRAKNMFIGFNGSPTTQPGMSIDRKATFQPYDMDTAIGTNNSGVLMFSPYLEDIDTVSSVIVGDNTGESEAAVFNAQDSVFFVNLRDSSRSEITSMYRDLRSNNVWSYNIVEKMYEAHQSKWCEAIFNEDGYSKYLIPLVNPVTKDEDTGELIRTDRYLTMLQGSKKEQRKWWLSNRFKYMDSKFITGDATNSIISARLFNSGNLVLTSAIDLYITVSFGGGTTPTTKRAKANTPTIFPYTVGTTVQEMETWIYSGDLITDVGDLSVFYPNEIDFSKATRLRRLKIGDSSPTYSNTHMEKLDVRNCSMLEYIDVRNCPNFAITVNLENSPRLKEAYFDNTSITGIDIADGCIIEKLHIPSTVTTLTLLNLKNLVEFEIPSYDNISRLMISGIDTNIVDPVELLSIVRPNTQINIQNIDLHLETTEQIDEFIELLNTMKGISRERGTNGDWMYQEHDKAQISGTIYTSSITGNQIDEYNSSYPYLRFVADHMVANVEYYNYDGSVLLYTETVYNGGNGVYDNQPERENDAQYIYTFIGWSRRKNSMIAESDAQENIITNRKLYASYSGTIRKYTATFIKSIADGDGVLYVQREIPYGTIPVYSGDTPQYTGEDTDGMYVFDKWIPDVQQITGNTTYVASFIDITPNTIKYLKKTIKEYNSSTDATTIASYGMYYMQNITYFKTYATEVQPYAIGACPKLTTIEFMNTSPIHLSANAFNGITNLNSLIIRSEEVAILDNINAFTGTNIQSGRGMIFVPSELVNAYKSNNMWNKFYIYSIDDYPIENYSTIKDSYEEIVESIHNNTYSSKYHVGDTIFIDNYGQFEIVGIDEDDLADGSGKAPITFMSRNILNMKMSMNNDIKSENGENGRAITGWVGSDIREELNTTYYESLPDIIKNNIAEVNKVTSDYYNGTVNRNGQLSTDKIWIPSAYEIGLSNIYEDYGANYHERFSDNNSRIKYNLENSTEYYFVRSASSKDNFICVNGIGSIYSNYDPLSPSGIVIGFCLKRR